MELRQAGRKKDWNETHPFGFEAGRSSSEISTAIRLQTAAARARGPDLGFVVCSLEEGSDGTLFFGGLNEEVEEFCCEDGGNEYEIRKVDALQAMGALVTKEAGSMSPMKFRMSKADKAPWVDMKFFRNKGTAEGRRHQRFREVVQMYDLHSCEGWSGNKEMVDALHGWASMNLDMSSRSVA